MNFRKMFAVSLMMIASCKPEENSKTTVSKPSGFLNDLFNPIVALEGASYRCVHLRDSGNGVLRSIDQMLDISFGRRPFGPSPLYLSSQPFTERGGPVTKPEWMELEILSWNENMEMSLRGTAVHLVIADEHLSEETDRNIFTGQFLPAEETALTSTTTADIKSFPAELWWERRLPTTKQISLEPPPLVKYYCLSLHQNL